LFQLAQLLVCDWLLEARTAMWEIETQNDDNEMGYMTPVPEHVLTKFQADLNSLRIVTAELPVRRKS
jgi:sterol regulatory element-binding transcription factor 1